MFSGGKLAPAPMRVSVSLKPTPGATSPTAKASGPTGPGSPQHPRHVASPDGRVSPPRAGVMSPGHRHVLVAPQPSPTSPPSPSRQGVGSPIQKPMVATRQAAAPGRSAYAPPVRPVVQVTAAPGVQAPTTAKASPKHLSPTKLQSPSSMQAPVARGAAMPGPPPQRCATMTSTIRTGESGTPGQGEEKSEKPKEQGRHNQLMPTMSLRPQSTPQGSRRLQTRRKIGNKTPEVEKFLVESLSRDPGSGQAQLNEADLQQIVSMMEYYEFDGSDGFDDEDGVGGASGYIFVVDNGSFEVRIDGASVATLGRGCTFGWNFLMKQPQSSSVFAVSKSGLWGADGQKIQQMITDRTRERIDQNRKLLDCVSMFKGLPPRQIELLSSAIAEQTVPAGKKVVEKGELSTALYFIRTGTLQVEENKKQLGPGDFFGERALLHHAPRSATVTAVTEAELLRLEAENLKSVVGADLMVYLSRSLILESLRSSQSCGQFNASQQSAILQKMHISEVAENTAITDAKKETFLLLAVVQGSVHDISRMESPQAFYPGQAFEAGAKAASREVSTSGPIPMTRVNSECVRDQISLIAGPQGAKVAILLETGLEAALADGPVEQAPSGSKKERFAQKMLAVKKVPIFRHLNKQQTERVVMSLQDRKCIYGEVVIRQGESGNHFFVIVKGETTVTIDGKKIRTQGKNASFGERALLFDEPRSATVQVSSDSAELWTLEKSVFKQIITEKMRRDLEYRISIQDAGVTLSDLKSISFLGAGAFSTVRLVEHRKTGAKYALKTCKRTLNGKMPTEMKTECDILAENDHPFILYMVAVFETKTYVSMLTEILAGGELWSALRKLPVMLPREAARFYTASILIAVEALWDRNVVYRDLKPENVMLDQEGYVKIIDFGVSKKLGELESRTYTVVGTPHYMAPEVFQGKGYGVEVDLWSLGIMLFEFVCGYLPFGTNLVEPRQVCSAVLRGKLKFPSAYKDEIGRDLIKGLLTQPVLKRLGAGVNGLQDVFKHPFFEIPGPSSMFDKLLGRELEPPYTPGPWRPPTDQKRPHGYSKEQFELFEHPFSKGQGPEVVKQNGFFCSVFRRNR